ncbi:uncharacterized protein [Parasteatoda tepidariorum]|uniref:uncharacterized protein n=1 Tax=Parasteatoda tepidariorum TaxID=114398 RepID=UPI0039BC811A
MIKEVKQLFPHVNIIHFQSDGPTTQYRNKTNFFLFAHFAITLGFKKATWNFSEAGHGKSPADGIGGFIKHYADQAVAHGEDITTTEQFLNVFRKEKVKVTVIEVKEANIHRVESIVPNWLKAVKNTMLLHQLVWEESKCEPCSHFLVEPYLWSIERLQGRRNSNISGPSKKLIKRDGVSKRFPSQVPVGQWVAVIFDDQWFPGVVESVQKKCPGNKLYVSFENKKPFLLAYRRQAPNSHGRDFVPY